MTQFDCRPLTLLLIAAAVAGSLALGGCATSGHSWQSHRRSADGASLVAKADWLKSLHTGLTQDLCAEDQVFRACYEVSESDCRARVQEAAVVCETELEPAIPEVLSDASGVTWGSQIGKCTGEGLFHAISNRFERIESESCTRILSEL